MVHTDRGRSQLRNFSELIGSMARVENPPRMEGRFMSMILVADREVIAEMKRKEEKEQKKELERAAAGSAEDTAPSQGE